MQGLSLPAVVPEANVEARDGRNRCHCDDGTKSRYTETDAHSSSRRDAVDFSLEGTCFAPGNRMTRDEANRVEMASEDREICWQ